MQDLALTPLVTLSVTLPPEPNGKFPPALRQPGMVLCSRVQGRERWYIDALEDNPRLAATVESVLRSEDGIEHATANPLTGRVLVRYSPDAVSETVQDLILRAVAFGPMSEEEFSMLAPRKSSDLSASHFLAAEIGCSALKMFVLGGTCPGALAAAGLLFLLHWRTAHTRKAVVRRHPRRLVANQAG
jgi:Heavy metal associated domain 2